MLHNCSQFRTPIVETENMCKEFVVHCYMLSPREKIFHKVDRETGGSVPAP